MSKHVLSFHRAAKAVAEIQEESKNGTDFNIEAFEEPFRLDGHECVAIIASWKEGRKHFSRQLTMKDDGTQAKIVRLFQGNASAEPMHKPGEELKSGHHVVPRHHDSFTAEL